MMRVFYHLCLVLVSGMVSANSSPSSSSRLSSTGDSGEEGRGGRNDGFTQLRGYQRYDRDSANGYSKAPRQLQPPRPAPRKTHDNSTGRPFRCFQTKRELREAIQNYDNHKQIHTKLALQYGWPIGKWCVDEITDFSYVFHNKRTFNEPLSHWDTSKATNMKGMFQDCQQFNQDLSHFNTSHVVDMSQMFEAAVRFEGKGLQRWNTQSVTNLEFMFLHALQFQTDISPWDVSSTTTMKGIFKDARSFTQEMHLDLLSSWNFHHHVDMVQMSDYWISDPEEGGGQQQEQSSATTTTTTLHQQSSTASTATSSSRMLRA